jgi:hypothetical protein
MRRLCRKYQTTQAVFLCSGIVETGNALCGNWTQPTPHKQFLFTSMYLRTFRSSGDTRRHLVSSGGGWSHPGSTRSHRGSIWLNLEASGVTKEVARAHPGSTQGALTKHQNPPRDTRGAARAPEGIVAQNVTKNNNLWRKVMKACVSRRRQTRDPHQTCSLRTETRGRRDSRIHNKTSNPTLLESLQLKPDSRVPGI